MLNPNAQQLLLAGGIFGRSLGHEGKALKDVINALTERPERAPLSLPPSEDIA